MTQLAEGYGMAMKAAAIAAAAAGLIGAATIRSGPRKT